MAQPRGAGEGFSATAEAWTFQGVGLSRAVTPPLAIKRNRPLTRRDMVDHWCITIGKSSPATHVVDNKAQVVAAGVPYIFSLRQEMYSERTRSRVQLYLARDRFRSLEPLLDGACGKAFDTRTGHLLAEYVGLLERHASKVAAVKGANLATAIEAMVNACLAPSASRFAQAQVQMDVILLERVRRAVLGNLRSPSLGVEKICREVAISRTRLYRLLDGEGGVVHYIQSQRLSEAFSILSDPANDMPIGEVSEMLCFSDPSTFSRAFRRHFGQSPKDVKGLAIKEKHHAISATNESSLDIGGFAKCLQGL